MQMASDVMQLRHGAADIDVIHCHTSGDHSLAALSLAGLTKEVPLLIRTIHSARSLRRRLGQRFLLGRADGLIVRSEYHLELLHENHGLAAENIVGGINTEHYSISSLLGDSNKTAMKRSGAAAQALREKARAQLGIPNDAMLIAHVALIANRGQAELVKALASDRRHQAEPKVILMFVGDGEGRTKLENLVSELGVGEFVRFVGYCREDALLRAYLASDVAFWAGPGNDAAGRAVLEAMAMELPLLAVSHPGFSDVLTPGNAFLLENTGELALTSAISAARAAWGDELRERGARGRELVIECRSAASEATQTLAFYNRLLGSK